MAAHRSYWADCDMGFDEAEMRRKLSEVADWLREQADDHPRPYLRAVTPDFEPAPPPRREQHILDELVQRRLAAQLQREDAEARMRSVLDRFDSPPVPRAAPLRTAVAEIVERQRHLDSARTYEPPSYQPPRDPIAAMEAAFERMATQFEQRLQNVAQQQPAHPPVQPAAQPVQPDALQRVQLASPPVERGDPVMAMESSLERLAVQFEQRTGQSFQAIDVTLQQMRDLMQQVQAPAQAAEAAAAQVVHSHLQLMAKATHERIDTVARDLADLRSDATEAERRMRDVMDTVRQTLEHIAVRLPNAGIPPMAPAAEPNLSARARAAAKLAIEESAENEPLELINRDSATGERRRFIAAARRSVLPEERRPEPKAKYKAPPAIPAPVSGTAQRLRITATDLVEPQPARSQVKRLVLSGAAAAALLLGIFAGSSTLLNGMFGETQTAQTSTEAAHTEMASPESVSADTLPPPVVAKVPQLFAPKEAIGPSIDAFAPSEPVFTGSVADQGPALATESGSAMDGPMPAPRPNVALPAEIGGETLRSQASAGNSNAQYEVGVRFAEGRGVPRDPQKAALWLERAARQGLPPAQYRYGRLAEKGEGMTKDVAIARRHYEQAATAGNVQAMHNLGVLYADGAFGKADLPAALDWFRKAAEHGVKDSQYNLGIFYARGIAVQKDPAQSFIWFSLAAAQGDTDAAAKRDQIGGKLDAAKLNDAKADVAAWTAKVAPIEANMVTPPTTGWDAPTGRASSQGKAQL